MRLVEGVKLAQLDGNQFHYTSATEIEGIIDRLEVAVAEDAGTDGRGAWEATFSE